ncbi:MAG TPA: hypothetical protein VGV64_00615, partial [Thermoplasmata archaeon]|nr:hypothetical protein [Thermoplasmata archaeon]
MKYTDPSRPHLRELRRSALRVARHGFLWGAVLLLLVPLLLLAMPQFSPDTPSPPALAGVPSQGPRGALPATAYPTAIRHVFVVFLENADLSAVQNSGPYEMGLAKNYTQATHYYAPCHPSAPEYLAATSGATWQCGSDSVNSYSSSNLGYLAQKAGLS